MKILNLMKVLGSAAPLVLWGCGGTTADASGNNGSSTTDASLASARVSPQIYLNHSYGVFSAATIDALRTNAYLNNEFIGDIDVEVRTTIRPKDSYTGTYLNMRETYLEAFAVGTFFGFPLGVMGLGIGDEMTGGLEKLQQKWQVEFGPTDAAIKLISHQIDGVQVPWFREVDLNWAAASDFSGIWAMEYVPNPGSSVPRTRHEARAPRYHPDKLAQNVQALIYGLPAGDLVNLRRSLTSAGFRVSSRGQGFVAQSSYDHGTTRAIVALPSAPGRLGLLAAIIRLNHEVRPHTEVLGDATLNVGIDREPLAALWFVPPPTHEEESAVVRASSL